MALPVGGLQYDHRADEVVADPFGLWSQLRHECPVLHSDRYGGFWLVSRFADVVRALVEVETFASGQGTTTPPMPVQMIPGDIDGELQRKYRSIVNPSLSLATVREFEPWMRETAQSALASLGGRSGFDLSDYAEPYAQHVALRALGFADEDLAELDRLTHIVGGGLRTEHDVERAGAELLALLTSTLTERAGQPRRDDVISAVVHGTVDDRPLTIDEQVRFLFQLTFGGFHTSSMVIKGALVWLADHPDERERLRTNKELMKTAVDEFVRYVSPISHIRRTTTSEVEIAGCPIKKGEAIMIGYGSANHDEAAFDRPDDVILERFPNNHVGFGRGAHRCIGSHLARLSVRVGLEEFLDEIPDFEVDDRDAFEWMGGEGRGLLHAAIVVNGS